MGCNIIIDMEIIAEKIDSLLPKKKIDIFGKDQLLHNTAPYYLLAGLMMLAHFGAGESGFLFLFIVYTVLPILDEFLSLDLRNPTDE